MTSPTYTYPRGLHPGEIRILTVLPSSPDEPITCSISETRLDLQPTYDALSYCWGSNKQDRTIYIDGESFCITRSLYEALQTLRPIDHPLQIWIDQICINQANIPEKNIQVQQMAKVYQCAQRTHVWLGQRWPGDENALDTVLEEIGYRSKLHFMAKYDAFRVILHQPWFGRLWTFQEALLSRRCVVYHGHATCDLGDLLNLRNIFNIRRISDENLIAQDYASARALLSRSLDNLDAINTLSRDIGSGRASSRARVASDPKDHVYGLEGILQAVEGRDHEDARVDYGASIAEIFTQATVHGILSPTGGGLRDLIAIHNEHEDRLQGTNRSTWWNVPPMRVYGLPSWVPDWSRHMAARRLRPQLYSAGGEWDRRLKKEDISSQHELLLDGAKICRIASVEPFYLSQRWIPDGWDRVEKEMVRKCSYPKSSRLRAFARTVIADTQVAHGERGAEYSRWPLGDDRLNWKFWRGEREVNNGELLHAFGDDDSVQQTITTLCESFMYSVDMGLAGRCFILTDG